MAYTCTAAVQWPWAQKCFWIPHYVEIFPYNIWVNDSNSNFNQVSNSITVEDNAIPTLTDLNEELDPLELGAKLTIQINATDISGIDTTLIELLGTNYSLTIAYSTIWEFIWVPSTTGFYPYTIWTNDPLGNWNSLRLEHNGTWDSYVRYFEYVLTSLFITVYYP